MRIISYTNMSVGLFLTYTISCQCLPNKNSETDLSPSSQQSNTANDQGTANPIRKPLNNLDPSITAPANLQQTLDNINAAPANVPMSISVKNALKTTLETIKLIQASPDSDADKKQAIKNLLLKDIFNIALFTKKRSILSILTSVPFLSSQLEAEQLNSLKACIEAVNADPEILDADMGKGKTLLYESIEHKHLSIAEYLIYKGATKKKNLTIAGKTLANLVLEKANATSIIDRKNRWQAIADSLDD